VLNEPVVDNMIPLPKPRSLHAILCESLTSTKALLNRLEAGVTVPRDQQREVVRLLYVACRHQVAAHLANLYVIFRRVVLFFLIGHQESMLIRSL
jgi:hypothetical protein